MSNRGQLKIRVKVGEIVHIGDSEVILDHISNTGWCAHVIVRADKDIKVWREPLTKLPEDQRDENFGNK